MTHLLKRPTAASNLALALSPAEVEVEQQELAQEEQDANAIRADIATNQNAIDHVLNAIDVATGMADAGVDSKITAAVFGTHVNAAGVPEELAEEMSVGVESAGADAESLGNEVLQSAKQIIMDIVAWIVKQYKKLKDLARRTFAKNFGSVKRSLAAWRKIKARVEGYQEEGRTVEDKSNLEIKRGAAYLVKGVTAQENPKDVVAWAGIPAEVEAFEKIVTDLENNLDKVAVSEAGSLAEFTTTVSELLKSESKVKLTSFDTGSASNSSEGLGLLGRQVLVAQSRIKIDSFAGAKIGTFNEEQLRSFKKMINGLSIGVKPSNVKLKVLDEVKAKVPTLEEMDVICDAHIELATNTLTLETSKKLAKLDTTFDKAIANSKKWSKDADTDSAADKRKAIAAAGMMSALLSTQQEATIGLVGDVVRCVSAVSKAHGSILGQALGRYTKAAA